MNQNFFNSISPLTKINFNLGFIAEHMFGSTFLNSLIKPFRDSTQKRIVQQVEGKSRSPEIEIDSHQVLDPEIFRENYLKKGRPVLVKGGATHWPALKEWGFDFFKENYGKHPVYLTHHKDLGDNKDEVPEETNLHDIIDGLSKKSQKYARFNPLLDVYPQLLEALDRNWLNNVMGRALRNHHVLFIGNKGTKTNIHNAGNENIFVQIRGKKRWLLWDQRATYIFNPEVNRAPAKASPVNPNNPDHSICPAFKYLPTYELILEEGDMLYIPSYLWHYVENETPTIGIGIRWLSPWNSWKNAPLLASLELFNTSPSIFKTFNWSKGFDFNKIILENLKRKK